MSLYNVHPCMHHPMQLLVHAAPCRWKQQVERCWQQGDKRSVAVCEGHQGWVNAARFSASGVVVSGSADESVIIW